MAKKSTPPRVPASPRESEIEDGQSGLLPKLRFPEFRGVKRWKTTNLGQVLTPVVRERSKPTVAYLGLGLRSHGKGTFLKPLEDPAKNSMDQLYEVKTNDLIVNITFAWEGAVAIARECDEGALVSHRFPTYTFEKSITTPEFFTYVILDKQFVYRLGVISPGGAGRNRVMNKSDFLKLLIELPSSAEQRKIASCLSTLDELIGAQGRKVAALRTQKNWLMLQLFPREGETQPRLRFPEFQDAGDWERTTIGVLVDGGLLYPPKDGNHGNIHPKSSDYVADGIPFIMASDLNGGLIDIVNCHFISKEQAETLQKGFAKEGDVLLSHKGTVGEVSVVRKINTPYLMLTPQVTYYRVKDRSRLSNEFLAQLFVAEAFQSNLLEVSGGGTRAYIGITEQAKLRVQLPQDAAEQQRIASCLSSLDELITAETQRLEALKTHKRGLMQQLFPSPEAT